MSMPSGHEYRYLSYPPGTSPSPFKSKVGRSYYILLVNFTTSSSRNLSSSYLFTVNRSRWELFLAQEEAVYSCFDLPTVLHLGEGQVMIADRKRFSKP